VIPEAPLERTDAGLVPAGPGWFVLNARDARWNVRPGRKTVTFTGLSEHEAETWFPQLGVNLIVLEPGEPNAKYHWEADQEGFLVLFGEALMLVEGEERPVRQWDFVHCPPETNHVFVGAGDGPCGILAMSSRAFQATEHWGGYTANELAERYGASVAEDTPDAGVAYEDTPRSAPEPYREGWLPTLS
jgi:uncharacterized cupin superfamily protein